MQNEPAPEPAQPDPDQPIPTTTPKRLSADDKTILMNEWKEIRETLRYFGNKRFAQLTVFMAAGGFILNAIYAKENPMPIFWGGVLGALLAAMFLIHEWTSVRYFKRFIKRGLVIERKVPIVRMLHSRPCGDIGTWTTYALYAILFIGWLAIAFCGQHIGAKGSAASTERCDTTEDGSGFSSSDSGGTGVGSRALVPDEMPDAKSALSAPDSGKILLAKAKSQPEMEEDEEFSAGTDMLAIASWNIQTGGTSTSKTALRPQMVKRALGRMAKSGYSLLAAQEIPSDASAKVLQKLLPAAGAPWEVAFVDTTSRMDNGFWFQPGVKLSPGADVLFATGTKDSKGRLVIAEEKAFHPPHLAHFTVGDFDFTIITLHLTFQGGSSEESKRELTVLLDFLDDYFEDGGNDPDVIICGDFNLPSLASGEEAGGLTLDDIIAEDGRFEDPARQLHVMVNDPTSRTPAKKGGKAKNNYDHFILSEDCLEEFDSAKRFSTSVLTADANDPNKSLTSDHFPIVALFHTKGDNIHRDK